MVGHVFVSYSRDDGKYVDKLVEMLRARGLPVWTDQGVLAGTEWVKELEWQISGCAAFVPVMSTSAKLGKWVNREIDYAEEKQKPIVPLLLSGTPFFRLLDLQYEDVRDGRMPREEFIASLTRIVHGPVVRPEPVPPVAPTVDPPAWRAPVLFFATLVLFLAGTFLTAQALGGDRSTNPEFAVGSCVSQGPDGRLARVNCSDQAARQVMQIVGGGRFCDDRAQIQLMSAAADHPSICVRAAAP